MKFVTSTYRASLLSGSLSYDKNIQKFARARFLDTFNTCGVLQVYVRYLNLK